MRLATVKRATPSAMAASHRRRPCGAETGRHQSTSPISPYIVHNPRRFNFPMADPQSALFNIMNAMAVYCRQYT
jgi:hypothetical protein